MIINMTNIKIIILLGLATYALCIRRNVFYPDKESNGAIKDIENPSSIKDNLLENPVTLASSLKKVCVRQSGEMDVATTTTTMTTTTESAAPSETGEGELSAVLNRRQQINEALEDGKPVVPQFRRVGSKNVFLEFKEFTRKQINEYETTFKKFDIGKDGFLDLEELKRMMEKLGVPQTHLALKTMIKEVDEDGDDKISFREFLLIYRKAYDGSLPADCGLCELARLTEINVDEVGVIGAKEFFEAKIEYQGIANRFQYELRQEMEEKKRLDEEKSRRKIAFKEKTAIFQ